MTHNTIQNITIKLYSVWSTDEEQLHIMSGEETELPY